MSTQTNFTYTALNCAKLSAGSAFLITGFVTGLSIFNKPLADKISEKGIITGVTLGLLATGFYFISFVK